MQDLKVGKIYRIIHLQSDICYVGSTFDALRNRWCAHKRDYNFGEKNISIYPYFKEFGIENFKIVLIKEFEVCDRAHLRAYEQLYINKLNCVNKINPFRIKWIYMKKYNKNYRNEHREELNEYSRNYHNEHKEELNEKCRAYHHENRDVQVQKSREYYKNNKTEICRLRKLDKVECECGSIVRRSDLLKHQRTEKHKRLME